MTFTTLDSNDGGWFVSCTVIGDERSSRRLSSEGGKPYIIFINREPAIESRALIQSSFPFLSQNPTAHASLEYAFISLGQENKLCIVTSKPTTKKNKCSSSIYPPPPPPSHHHHHHHYPCSDDDPAFSDPLISPVVPRACIQSTTVLAAYFLRRPFDQVIHPTRLCQVLLPHTQKDCLCNLFTHLHPLREIKWMSLVLTEFNRVVNTCRMRKLKMW